MGKDLRGRWKVGRGVILILFLGTYSFLLAFAAWFGLVLMYIRLAFLSIAETK